MLKLALAGVMALAQSPSSVTYTSNPYVFLMTCGGARGTGFKTDRGYISVHHVTRHAPCSIKGKAITVTYADPRGDFSTFTVDNMRGGLPVRCTPLYDGEWVFAQGHARGDPFPQIMALKYSKALTDRVSGPWMVLVYNRVIPGMSGGPIVDAWGRVVGTVNAYSPDYPISFSRALKDTPICQ